ncbi:MAG TPA: hypothetical protein VE990_07605 [Acidimicrobiales bacterium]|nr:hypothetical protein [Acidimicrobiales bacterium]
MVGSTSRGGTRRGPERYLPLAYFALAIAVVALILPSALRPPAQQSNQSSELSPNAPHQNQQSIIAALSEANSGTNGAGAGTGPASAQSQGPPPATASSPTSGPPSFCPFGVGDPPLQFNSPYAPPCAPAYTGRNPGSTYHGVSATTVKIAVADDTGATFSSNGPVADQPTAAENSAERFFTDMQIFLNHTFQFWGRSLQLIADTQGSGANGDTKAEVAAAKDYQVFGAVGYTPPFCPEAVHDAMPNFCRVAVYPLPVYQQDQPYLYSWWMNETLQDQFLAESVCSNLVGRRAEWAGAGIQGKVRKFGLIYSEGAQFPVDGNDILADLKSTCGLVPAVSVGYDINQNDPNGSQALADAVVKFQANGVTTVIDEMDYVAGIEVTDQANSSGYVPEWYMDGASGIDRNQLAALMNQAEWSHAFGLTNDEMEIPPADWACYQVIQEVDPGFSPNQTLCTYHFESLVQMAAGIQAAGPDLTPATLERGLIRNGYKFYSRPAWPAGGGFGPDDPTYIKNAAEIWWNPGATNPVTGDPTGAYEYLDGGARYRLGQLPPGERPYFSQGSTVPAGGYSGSW